MRWLVDGMNLMGSRPDGWWRDRAAARRRIIAQLGELSSTEGAESVSVVFDGRPVPAEVAQGEAVGVAVSFAPGGPDAADRVIVRLVEGSEDPNGLTVVTSDGALAAAVEAAGAVVVGSGTFRRLLDRHRT